MLSLRTEETARPVFPKRETNMGLWPAQPTEKLGLQHTHIGILALNVLYSTFKGLSLSKEETARPTISNRGTNMDLWLSKQRSSDYNTHAEVAWLHFVFNDRGKAENMIHVFDPTAVRKVSAPGSNISNGALLFFLAPVKRVHLSAPSQCHIAAFCIRTSVSAFISLAQTMRPN